jgi:hypothetical protein
MPMSLAMLDYVVLESARELSVVTAHGIGPHDVIACAIVARSVAKHPCAWRCCKAPLTLVFFFFFSF